MCRRTHARGRIFPDRRIRSCGGHSVSIGKRGAQNLPCAQEALSHRHTGRPGLAVREVPAATGSTYVRRNWPTHYGRSLIAIRASAWPPAWRRSVDGNDWVPDRRKLSREARSWRGSLHKVSRRSGEAQGKALLVVPYLRKAVQSSGG